MTTQPTRYRQIEVSGTPRELGRQIGEAAREEILGFSEISLQRVNKTVRVSRDTALTIAKDCISHVERYSADMFEEIRGMAEGSGVSVEDLMMLQTRNQLRSEESGGCTSVSIAAKACTEGRALVGQNWDNDPALDPITIVLVRRCTGKPALMNITQAGLIAYIGFSDAGIGVCLNTLPAPSRPTGVPHYFTVRGIYESTSLEEAVHAVRRAERAIAANIILATPQGPADLEVTLDGVRVLQDPDGRMLAHTNHCLHPELLPINDENPELLQSTPRQERIERLLGDTDTALNTERMKAMLSDHDNYPTSICRHTNDDPAHGFQMSVFSVIIDPQAGQMHISRGTPCDHPYETYQLN